VRREKALDFGGCNSRPETGSLYPLAGTFSTPTPVFVNNHSAELLSEGF